MKKAMKKTAAVLLSSCLITGLLPVTALAGEGGAAGSRVLTVADGVAGTAEVATGAIVSMNVTVFGGGFATMTAQVRYDANLFEYESCTRSVFSGDTWIIRAGEGVVQMSGTAASDLSEGTVAAVLAFTAKDPGEAAQTGSFTITGGAISLEDQACYDLVAGDGTGDSVTVTASESKPDVPDTPDTSPAPSVPSTPSVPSVPVTPPAEDIGDEEVPKEEQPELPGEDIDEEEVPKEEQPELPDEPVVPDEDVEDEDIGDGKVPKEDQPNLPDESGEPSGPDEEIGEKDAPRDSQPAGETGQTEQTDDAVPETGDSNHLALWTLLSAFSAGGLAMLSLGKRKKTK